MAIRTKRKILQQRQIPLFLFILTSFQSQIYIQQTQSFSIQTPPYSHRKTLETYHHVSLYATTKKTSTTITTTTTTTTNNNNNNNNNNTIPNDNEKTLPNSPSCSNTNNLTFIPSKVDMIQVTKSYPVTFLRTLFSSVPKREYALENITTTFGTHSIHNDFPKFSETENMSPALSPSLTATKTITNSVKDSNRITLLIGASSSGKSTLLQLLAGLERPTSGTILWNNHNIMTYPQDVQITRLDPNQPSAHKFQFWTKPIIIDSKPSITTMNDSKSVFDWIQESSGWSKMLPPNLSFSTSSSSFSSFSSTSSSSSSSTTTTPPILTIQCFLRELSERFAKALTLSESQLKGKPSDLTPSGQYLFGLACACVQSVCQFIPLEVDTDSDTDSDTGAFKTNDLKTTMTKTTKSTTKEITMMSITELVETIRNNEIRKGEEEGGGGGGGGLYSPILLLDELLDVEHPSIVQQVCKGLQGLTDIGGVVICVTHKPQFFLQNHDPLLTTGNSSSSSSSSSSSCCQNQNLRNGKNDHFQSGKQKRVITLSAGNIMTDVISY